MDTVKYRIIGVFLILLGTCNAANATLFSRLGGQAVYDSDLDITWLADANLAQSNTFGLDPGFINANGTTSWIVAHYYWLPALNADGGTGYLGFNDWRFPATLQPDPTCSGQFPAGGGSVGTGCTGSEMGHLFYEELGGTAGVSILDSTDPDLALFQNLGTTGSQLGIWSDACCNFFGDDFAYYFFFDVLDSETGVRIGGFQETGPQFQSLSWVPWAVRDGDVGVVPEPAAIWLFGIGLIGLVGFSKRRKAV